MSPQATTSAGVWLAGLMLALAGCASTPPGSPAAPAALPPAAAPAPAPAGPAAAPPPQPARPEATGPRYRCDHGLAFSVSYGQDSATLDATQRGRETLLRDAGGVTPQQTVYSNEHLRAEFGLGNDGREAVLHYVDPPLEAHCTRE